LPEKNAAGPNARTTAASFELLIRFREVLSFRADVAGEMVDQGKRFSLRVIFIFAVVKIGFFARRRRQRLRFNVRLSLGFA
jgi:hypothetical protein